MRAYGFTAVGGPEQEAFLDVPEPEPGQGELVVRVRAAAVNPGDWKLRDGAYGVAGPAVLGREVAGTVERLGADVTGFAVGDEVFGGCPGMVGGFAALARVTASFAAHRPDGVTPADAASLPVAAGTAWDALNGLGLPPGATLLVNGAGGGVGAVAVQLAVARGLRVLGTASPAKHALLTTLGAEPVAYGDGVVDRLRQVAPDGVDAVFDLVGGGALRAVAALVADPGRLRSVADKPLVTELGGHDVARDRSHGGPRRAGHPGGARRAGPAGHGGVPVRARAGRDARGGVGARPRQGRARPRVKEPSIVDVMVELKTPGEVDAIAAAGVVVSRILETLRDKAAPGITPRALDAIAADMIADAGAVSSFRGYHPRWRRAPTRA